MMPAGDSGGDWLIFHSGPRLFWGERARRQNLRGLWYDGESTSLAGFCERFRPRTLLVEESISERALEVMDPAAGTRLERLEDGQEQRTVGPRAFLMSSDTLVHSLRAAWSEGDEAWLPRTKDENAEQALARHSVSARPMPMWADVKRYRGLVLANDWGPDERYQVVRFRRRGVPTVCLQESVIDFSGADRMIWADYPLIQGLPTISFLDRDVYFLTGNPRYEELTPIARPDSPRVLINSNFTYGVHEDARDAWVGASVRACERVGLDYVVAQHPRDRGDLSRYNVLPSSATSIHEALAECSTIITRFSSLVHEGLALGRDVVYFNPHRERLFYDFEADGVHLIDADDPQELEQALSRLSGEAENPLGNPFYDRFIMLHCGSSDGRASQRVHDACDVATSGRTERLAMGDAAAALWEVGRRGLQRVLRR